MSQFDLFAEPPAAPQAPPERAKRRTSAVVRACKPAATLIELAARLPARLRLGTSSWSFPGWVGQVYADHYAEAALAHSGLAAYARHPLLRTVGVDRTFYAPLEAAEFALMAAAVPADFRFLVKAHAALTTPAEPWRRQQVTTPGPARFLDAAYAAEQVVAPVLEGLGERTGVILFQFPPLGPPYARSALRFADHLERFLDGLPALPVAADGRGPRYAVEVRNREFIGPAYAAALGKHGVVHCLNVHPRMPGVTDQSRQLQQGFEAVGHSVRPPLTLVRWMLHPTQEYGTAREAYAPFDQLVDPDPVSRAAVAAEVCAALGRDEEVIVIVNNKAEGSSPLTLQLLAEAVNARLTPAV